MPRASGSAEPAGDLLAQPQLRQLASTIEDRRSKEIIIALVGPVASGVSTAAEVLFNTLKQTFGYDVCPIIKLSDVIRAEARRVDATPINSQAESMDRYISDMQTMGNQLREKFGGSYLAEKAIESIYGYREEVGGVVNNVPQPGRRAYILDSIKNLEELRLLKEVYGKSLCVIGVFAPDEIRNARLKANGVRESSIKIIVDRDQLEVPTFGQQTRKLFVESDFFICNDRKQDELRRRIERFLNIVFGVGIHTPTRPEAAMYEAASAAAKSACMSRQVGAAILSAKGEIIAVGHNDVPRHGGGLYVEDDQSIWDAESRGLIDVDHRCFKWSARICHNETRRTEIVQNISRLIASSNVLKRGCNASDIVEILAGTEIDNLTEFSRSIHAEMEAILSVARDGRHSLVGATLYTTTYPCHNCARHIVAAGIKSVHYIEPYKKSLAIALHSDAVTEDPADESKVVFSQYSGVAPRNYLSWFRPAADRKKDGKARPVDPRHAIPILKEPLDSRFHYEAKVIADLNEKEQTQPSEST